MTSFLTISVPNNHAYRRFIFKRYLKNEICNNEISIQQFVNILTKLSLYNYDIQTGTIIGMKPDERGHLVISTLIVDGFGHIVSSKIVEMLSGERRPCYEIRINGEYEKKRVIFATSIKAISHRKSHNIIGYFLQYGFTKTNQTDVKTMNRLTNELASDIIEVMIDMENHDFSPEAMARWKVDSFTANSLNGGINND